MKTSHLVMLVILFTACTPPQTQHETIEKSIEEKSEELINALYDFNLAFAAADSSTLDQMLTDKYRHTNGTSAPYTKSVWLNYIQSRKAKIASGELVMEDYGMKDTQMTFYGNTALVNGVVYSMGVENGEPFDKQFRVTHLWVYEAERWKRAGFHDGVMEPNP